MCGSPQRHAAILTALQDWQRKLGYLTKASADAASTVAMKIFLHHIVTVHAKQQQEDGHRQRHRQTVEERQAHVHTYKQVKSAPFGNPHRNEKKGGILRRNVTKLNCACHPARIAESRLHTPRTPCKNRRAYLFEDAASKEVILSLKIRIAVQTLQILNTFSNSWSRK